MNKGRQYDAKHSQHRALEQSLAKLALLGDLRCSVLRRKLIARLSFAA